MTTSTLERPWEEYKEYYRSMIPQEARGLTLIKESEVDSLLGGSIEYGYCGNSIDLSKVRVRSCWSIESFTYDCARKVEIRIWDDYPNGDFPDCAWIAEVTKVELEEMLRYEEYGRHLLFVASIKTLEKKWFLDHVYTNVAEPAYSSKEEANFGYTAWELKYLLPMFPELVTLVALGW